MAKTMFSRLKRNVLATDIQRCYRGLIGLIHNSFFFPIFMGKKKELCMIMTYFSSLNMIKAMKTIKGPSMTDISKEEKQRASHGAFVYHF